jgi:hypothetical protein
MGTPPVGRLAVINRAAIRIPVRAVVRLGFIHKMSWLRQPMPCSGGVTVVKVVDGRFDERLANLFIDVNRHFANP